MDFIDKINSTMNYIETNLLEEIDYEELAKISGTSCFNFQRMFSFITNMSISEYIRRRRLTQAAFDLQQTNIKIIDIAIKYGYDSHESFTRAFQKLHNITPSQARKMGAELKAYPQLVFSLSIKGVVKMDYKIEKKPAFKMFGYEKTINMENGLNTTEVPQFWDECMNNGLIDKLSDDSGIKIGKDYSGLYAVNAIMCYKDTGKNTFPYLIGSIINDNSCPQGYEVVEIPEFEWAIFKTPNYTRETTSAIIQEVWKRIFNEWFPASNYKHACGPEAEMYYIDEKGKEYCEIWIPIEKK